MLLLRGVHQLSKTSKQRFASCSCIMGCLLHTVDEKHLSVSTLDKSRNYILAQAPSNLTLSHSWRILATEISKSTQCAFHSRGVCGRTRGASRSRANSEMPLVGVVCRCAREWASACKIMRFRARGVACNADRLENSKCRSMSGGSASHDLACKRFRRQTV